MSSFLKQALTKVDTTGKQVEFTVGGMPKSKTALGGFMTILKLAAILSYFLVLLMKVVNK